MLSGLSGNIKRFILSLNNKNQIDGVFNVKIVNKTETFIWLAKDTIGDLHGILPAGKSMDIKLPLEHQVRFYAYRAANDLSLDGLDYIGEREFKRQDVWIIQ